MLFRSVPSPAPAVAARKRSLRAQVVNWLLILFGILLLVSFAVSYIAAVDFANLPYDRQLLATARALASHVRPGTQGLAFELPETTRLQLLVDDEDRIVYKVIGDDGTVLGGDAVVPWISAEENQLQPELTTMEIGGVAMRLATIQRPVAGAPAGTRVGVQVAETLNKRTVLARQIFFKLLIPQILLAALPIGGLWLGVGTGLAPLERLKRAITVRQQYDLSPLPIEDDTPDELRPLVEAFNELLARLQTLLSSQQRFVADAAHQLRTPLAGLKTQAELALRLDDPHEVREALRQVLAAARRGSTLANQLLALARHEQGPHDHGLMQRLDLNRVVEQATVPYVQFALRKRIDLGFEPAGGTLQVAGEPVSLGEMVGNLIDNAVKYGGVARVRVGREGEVRYSAVPSPKSRPFGSGHRAR